MTESLPMWIVIFRHGVPAPNIFRPHDVNSTEVFQLGAQCSFHSEQVLRLFGIGSDSVGGRADANEVRHRTPAHCALKGEIQFVGAPLDIIRSRRLLWLSRFAAMLPIFQSNQ